MSSIPPVASADRGVFSLPVGSSFVAAACLEPPEIPPQEASKTASASRRTASPNFVYSFERSASLHPQEPLDGSCEFFDLLVSTLAVLDGLADAVLDMVSEKDSRNLLRGGDDAADLGEDVYAVSLLVYQCCMPRTCPSIRLRRFWSFSLSPSLMYPCSSTVASAVVFLASCISAS
jgi:hypothetical protein